MMDDVLSELKQAHATSAEHQTARLRLREELAARVSHQAALHRDLEAEQERANRNERLLQEALMNQAKEAGMRQAAEEALEESRKANAALQMECAGLMEQKDRFAEILSSLTHQYESVGDTRSNRSTNGR